MVTYNTIILFLASHLVVHAVDQEVVHAPVLAPPPDRVQPLEADEDQHRQQYHTEYQAHEQRGRGRVVHWLWLRDLQVLVDKLSVQEYVQLTDGLRVFLEIVVADILLMSTETDEEDGDWTAGVEDGGGGFSDVVVVVVTIPGP